MKLISPTLQWVVLIVIAFIVLETSAIATRRAIKNKPVETAVSEKEEVAVSPSPDTPEQLSARQGHDSEYQHYDDSSVVETSELVKKTQNVSDANKASKSIKEESPLTGDAESEEHLSKADFSRESRGNKNPRIYYDDTTPRFGHQGEDSPNFENPVRQGKQKDGGKFYFPKTYLGSKSSSPKKGHKPSPSIAGITGKRVPDHISYDEEAHSGHEFPVGHALDIGVGHEEHEHSHGTGDLSPYHHDVEEHHYGKGHGPHHHVSGYGYHHHYGTYRHTIGDKVDAVGKALQVLIPSALLITGVSALFPNRVHVPTTPNKYRQKRSVFRRRSHRAMLRPPPPVPQFSPEFDDIPTHILHAEHRIMEGNPEEMYPEYGKRQGVPENVGFDPFKVFKGPGPETSMRNIHDSLPLPEFPNMPELGVLPHHTPEYDGSQVPPSTYGPVSDLPEEIPPTMTAPEVSTTQMTIGSGSSEASMEINNRARPAAIIRRRKVSTRKPPIFMKETTQPLALNQRSSEVQKTNYLLKNSVAEDFKFNNPVKAEEEFMASLQNLVTPDVANILFKSKQETQAQSTKNFDLSPDGPVMGLLTSYAQHQKDTPACQKRALCELAVKGKEPKSTKFEAFLWSVATLVPDVFSEMYDLQEVFQGIRDERCERFHCPNPNLDLQVT